MSRLLVVAACLSMASVAMAQPPPAPTASASALPPGHPPTDALPPGHPPTGEMPPGHPPAGHAQRDMFNPPQDQVLVDENLPPGTIDIQIYDGSRQPRAGTALSLQILENMVAEGEKTSSQAVTTNDTGRYRFSEMKFGTGVSYRVVTKVEDATFSSEPFGLKDSGGVRVILHAFEPVYELAQSAFVMEAVVLLEIKEDSIAVNHLLRTLNIGDRAFVARGIRMPLPEGWHAFNKEESPTGVGMIERDGHMELVGTYPPGQNEMTFRYQLPLDGSSDQALKLPLPPRVLATRVVIGAGPDMSAEIAGFPTPQAGRWHDGKRVLEAQKKVDMRGGMEALMQNNSPAVLDIKLSGLPTPGPARLIALLLAACAVGGGAYSLAWARGSATAFKEQRDDLVEARDALLEELSMLEKAHRKGDVGPKSYERLRNALLDALARIVSRIDAAEAVAKPDRQAAVAIIDKAATKKKAKKKTAPEPKRARAKA